MPLVLNGMHGMGDNIYQRAFVRELKHHVYLVTSWPQLYSDLTNVFPVKPAIKLRTQKKNVLTQPHHIWHKPPMPPLRKIMYGGASLRNGSILKSMRLSFRTNAKIFDLPKFEQPLLNKPYAVVRPVTIRTEWKNEARNPDPEYICIAAKELKSRGYTTVSVADLEEGAEWSNQMPACDINYNNGELSFESLMGLIQGSSVVVGGVGWIVPASVAAGVPLITVLGGHGGHNHPDKIAGEPMDLTLVRWIFPDNYCMCTDMLHRCDKTITGFNEKFNDALESLCLTK